MFHFHDPFGFMTMTYSAGGSLRNGGGLGAVGAVLGDHDGAVFLIGNGVRGDGAHGEGSQNSSEETHFDDFIEVEIDVARLIDKERLG